MEGLVIFCVVMMIVLAAALVIGLSMASWKVADLRKTVAAQDKRIEALQGRLAKQDAAIKAMQTSSEDRVPDDAAAIVRAAAGWRRQGLWPTLANVGLRGARAYLRARRITVK